MLYRKPVSKLPFGKLGRRQRLILKLILKKEYVKVHTGFSWFRIRPNGSFL
jgi:hypothetical protein